VQVRAQLQHSGDAVPTRRHFLIGTAFLAATTAIAPARAAAVAPSHAAAGDVKVERHGSEIRVEAHAEVGAAVAQTWSTLVDYDRLAEFIPDMAFSHILSRNGSTAVVEQQGRASFGPFHQSFRLVLAVEERPGESIDATALDGDFRRFNARYDLQAIDSLRTRIQYRATLEPNAAVPPLVGLAVMRSLIRRQFEAMLGEIERRAALVDRASA
jgi:ribosome-associated toxin RatA of RatAB toxin-antitoxin module